jgi:transposase
MSKVRKTDGDQEQFWRMAIETWQSSGLSVRQFCTDEGLSEPSFYSWRKKLSGASVEDDQGNAKQSAFIEVAMPQYNSASVELVLASGNTLRIPVGVDPATLSTILSAARAVGLC